jgi:cobyrinic acid a,c-diamide synthase
MAKNEAFHGAKGVIIAAPTSGGGKTVLSLGLLRHLARSGVRVSAAKAGPDYIDPAYHKAAGGRACFNLDIWAMQKGVLNGALKRLSEEAEIIVCEGVMGLFDGAVLDRGSTADLAAATGWPVILVMDVRAQGASAAAVLRGFSTHRDDVKVAGVIFNRCGSERHAQLLKEACAKSLPDIPVLGCIPRTDAMSLPERHLGLVQAVEHDELDAFIDGAADVVEKYVDVSRLVGLAASHNEKLGAGVAPLAPLGQRISVARDRAFAFCYDLTIEGWRDAGAEISFFSPLNNEQPNKSADAIYLCGGYPELHAKKLSANEVFLDGLRQAAARGVYIFGECGGYMVLADALIDKDGESHKMAGLLPLQTSFAKRKRHLGYRCIVACEDSVLGPKDSVFYGHEFHYATTLSKFPKAAPLFQTFDAKGCDLGPQGLVVGSVAGSFIHLICRSEMEA